MSDITQRTAVWVDAGIIDATQADAIVAHESSVAPDAPDAGGEQHGQLAGSLGTLGGVLVGLGVLLTVAANWSNIGDTAKLLLIVSGIVVANGIALRADRRGAAHWIGTAGYTVGALTFAGGVFLLGQVYNVHAHDPLGFLVIAITTSIIAVLVARRLVGYIAIAAWVAWALHELITSLARASDEETAVTLIGAGALLAITAIAIGWILDGIAERAPSGSINADLAILGAPFRAIGQLGLLGLLVPISFAWHADAGEIVSAPLDSPLLITAIASLAAAVAVARFAQLDQRRMLGAALAVTALLVLGAALAFNPFLAGVLANVVLAAGGLGLAWLGLVADRRDIYAWGVGWIIALIATRYVDVMVTSALGGLGFIGAGLLLIGCAWLVGRSRRIWQERDA